MRHVSSFNPEWGYLAPAPSLLRTARVFLVAVAIGASASAAVVFSLMDRPAAETSVAARTLVLSPEPSQPTFGARLVAQRPAQSEPGPVSKTLRTEASGATGLHDAAVAAHASAGAAAPAESAVPIVQSPPVAAALAEAPTITTTDAPPAQALVLENNTALAAVAPAAAPALKAPAKKPRVARAAVPPRYDVPRYAAPRFEPRHDAMQRGPYALLRQFGTFGQAY